MNQSALWGRGGCLMGTEQAFVSVSPVSGSEAAAVPSTSVHEALTVTDSLPAPLLVPNQP